MVSNRDLVHLDLLYEMIIQILYPVFNWQLIVGKITVVLLIALIT